MYRMILPRMPHIKVLSILVMLIVGRHDEAMNFREAKTLRRSSYEGIQGNDEGIQNQLSARVVRRVQWEGGLDR